MSLIKYHLSYLLSKLSTIVLAVSLILVGIIYLTCALEYQSHPYFEAHKLYQNQSGYLFQLISSFIFIFIYTYSFMFKNDNYGYLIISFQISRLKYFYYKLLSLQLILVVFFVACYLNYVIAGMIIITNFQITVNDILFFLETMSITTYYCLLAVFFVLLLKSVYSMTLVIIIRIISMSVENGFNLLILSVKQYPTTYDFIYPIVVISILSIILGIYYVYRDYIE